MTAETMAFKTELKQLLHLIIHSLYSHKDVFLRELISNASDAIDKVRFQSLTNADVLEGDGEFAIQLIPDPSAGTLTISDNGVGMSRETIVEHLGTIARSGTREFLDALRQADAQQRPELIGRFGVGFYSAFMVADKVTVITRPAGDPGAGVRWESDGQGEFQLEPFTKARRGTDVVLHLKEDSKEFLEEYRLRQLVKKYSDFVEHPIALVTRAADGEEKKEVLNARKAIWLRNKSEITEEQYAEFYKHLSHDQEPPLRTVHYNAEGQVEFRALLFLPRHRPFDLIYGDSTKGLHLYIQRVFILDDCETLLPHYLRFVRGVVDSPDLPLNVSREILQQSAPLEKIKSNLTSKVLSTLDELKRKDFDQYASFYADLGSFLKEGAYQDWENKSKLADLLLYESTKTEAGKLTTLADYAERMPEEQKEIFYLAGERREQIERSPLLETFRAKGWEVLLVTDPADEIVLDSVREFKGKPIKPIDRASAETAQVSDEDKKRFEGFLAYCKRELPAIKEARLTARLKESAACLVADDGAMSAHMERLMARLGRQKEAAPAPRIFELNPEHPLVKALLARHTLTPDDPTLHAALRLLYDQSVIAEGSKVQDPADFAQRINDLLLRQFAS